MKQNLFKWVLGHHKTGYWILTLMWWQKRERDCYLIHYPPGSSIPPHRDVVKNREHYRLNIVLTHPKGGEFICDPPAMYQSKWLNYFRPDLSTHSVTPVTGKRSRYVLSFGWSRKTS